MDYMKGYRLEPNETGFTLIFYLDEHFNEFSDELDAIRLPSKRKYKNFKQYVIDNFSHLNVTKVKVMLGPALIMSFILGADHGSAEAASQQQTAHSHFHEVKNGDLEIAMDHIH
ncbi:hypothetical protein [Alkalibacillus haloalkaliphilus]|uniref:hypothetical protein n=1 Tax=Alkalibacillus haloalkaliphilus TaxID=94136 RepID=UPI002935A84C|nr:hypothetical protein [Alkalibacillus haloalkaliphilus]MDV2582894.1 hypothetical protein [Alkalibacillus haloalkaliphilus]